MWRVIYSQGGLEGFNFESEHGRSVVFGKVTKCFEARNKQR